MKLGIINTVYSLQEHFEQEFQKVGLGTQFQFFGDFSKGLLSKERAKRNITRAILDCYDENIDIIVICTDRKLGKYEFLSELGDSQIVYFNERSISDLREACPNFIHELTHMIDRKLYRKYESQGCGCSACRDCH